MREIDGGEREYFECECGEEITQRQHEEAGGLCSSCVWLLDK
jgi:hypothetical protein